MAILMIIIFVIGYLGIAFEHPLKINKAGVAILTGIILWVIYILSAGDFIPLVNQAEFEHFLAASPSLQSMPLADQQIRFVVDSQIIEHIGDISEILLFLMGAMAIVELIDAHGGFEFITNRINTRNKHKLLWMIAGITFFMSAVLDNLTTSIVMVMMLRKIVANYKERWLFGSLIIIAANSGGAWSPIGDVTTIMLWIKGNITSVPTITNLILPCIVSVVIPTIIASRLLHGILTSPDYTDEMPPLLEAIGVKERLSILVIGVLCLLSIPVFKTYTHLPPFMGVLAALGIMWVYTEVMYRKITDVEESIKNRVSKILKHIDMPTIFFFLGILLSVAALQCAGVLTTFSTFLDDKVHNIYVINTLIGIFSAIVDNVPLVAGAIGMYGTPDAAMAAAAADPAYAAMFMQDGVFWQMLTYCAGVGGSMLIVGSAAGVVVMGLEKINFIWYAKNITLMALSGYLAGIGVYIIQSLIF